MFVVTVTFRLKPGCWDEFVPLMVENATASKGLEPGCKQFDVCLGDDTRTIFLYEIYDDAAAFQDHLVSDHYKKFDVAVTDMIEDKTVHQFQKVLQ